MKNPISEPAANVPRSTLRNPRAYTTPITMAARENRSALKENTDANASASFTTTKVAPQISVHSASARSACRRRFIGKVNWRGAASGAQRHSVPLVNHAPAGNRHAHRRRHQLARRDSHDVRGIHHNIREHSCLELPFAILLELP